MITRQQFTKPPSCKGCPLEHEAYVPGYGPAEAKLVILGQCPGPDEVAQGRPFVGGSGRILDHAIAKGGNSRGGVYVTNAVKCYVKPKTPVPAGAVRQCRPILERELAQLPGATTLLTLGQEAYAAVNSTKRLVLVHDRRVSRKDSSVRLRGCPEPLDLFGRSWTLVGTLHPAFLAYSGFALSRVFESDVDKAYRFSRGEARLQRGTVDTNPSDSQVRDLIRELLSEGSGGIDIETPEPQDLPEDQQSAEQLLPVSVIALSVHPLHSMALYKDRFKLLEPLFNLRHRRNEAPVLPQLWAFNSSFDFYHLSALFDLDAVTEACAMTLFHLLYPDSTRKDLATMMSFYTDLPFHKYLQDIDPEYYNGADTWGVHMGALEMLKEVRYLDRKAEERFPWIRMRLEDLFFDRIMPTVKTVRQWDVVGARYDSELSETMLLQATEVLDQYSTWWQDNLGVSWQSPKQLIELFEGMGAKVPLRKRTSQHKDKETGIVERSEKWTPSVDDEALSDLVLGGGAAGETAKLVKLMRGYKKASDFCALDKRVPGLVFTRAKVHGQAGGRIQTIEENLQQIPERCPDFDPDIFDISQLPYIEPRNAFVADCDDDVIISADFSQIEFWLYAWYSQCRRALEIKETGTYLYGGFYEDIWKEPFFVPGRGRTKRDKRSDLPPWKLLVAKSWPLGFIYGRGAPDPADQGLPITKSAARDIHSKFHRDYPEIGAFHRQLERLVERFGYLQTTFGRIRSFTNPRGQRNEFLAFPGQSTAVDVLVTNALVPLSQELPERFGPRSRILFTVHDSIVCNVTVAGHREREAYDFIKRSMERPLEQLDGYSIPAEVKIGRSWGTGTSLEKYLGKEAVHA